MKVQYPAVEEGPQRCPWCRGDALLTAYHDSEWGVPVHDDTRLFEMLVLEGAQAGLSWLTILKKRENYRHAFAGFDVEAIARFTDSDKQKLLADPGIVRNRLKIESVIKNARGTVKIREHYGSLDAFCWRFVDNVPIRNRWRTLAEIPASTRESDRMSREFKKNHFNFAGPTICYAFMQAVGMVNDHLVDCFRHKQVRP